MSAQELAKSTDLPSATETLLQAAEKLNQAAERIAQSLQTYGSPSIGQPALSTTASAAATAQINIFEDDPFSEASPTINPPIAGTTVVDAPVNNNPLLQIRFTTPEPVAARHPPGSPNFRHWVAKEAITRGINFWTPLLPVGTRWSTINPMPVTPVAGQSLNANYTRVFGLRFFQQTVRTVQIFSIESPDVACHELGHAILDALRPQLFDAAFSEVDAFHESFGDMCAILSSLQLASLRRKVLLETQGRLNVNSRLSRLAEQLGWGIRQLSPTAVDPDCLRNAANRFFYRPPSQLPTTAPASQLSSEGHSFSRVFTGAFLDALARMLTVVGGASDASVLAVTRDLGLLLADGIRTASVVPAYYSQVAASMIQADTVRNRGRYRAALNSAFLECGILSPTAIRALTDAPVPEFKAVTYAAPHEGRPFAVTRSSEFPSMTRDEEYMLLDYNGGSDEGYRLGLEDAPELPLTRIDTSMGFTLLAHAGAETKRFDVAPAAFAGGRVETPTPEREVEDFIQNLIQLRRIDFRVDKSITSDLQTLPHDNMDRVTHMIVETSEGMTLKRLQFNCGFHHH